MNRKGILRIPWSELTVTEELQAEVWRHKTAQTVIIAHEADLEGVTHVYADLFFMEDEMAAGETYEPNYRWATDGISQAVYDPVDEKWRDQRITTCMGETSQWVFRERVLKMETDNETAEVLYRWFKDSYSSYAYCMDVKDPKYVIGAVSEGIHAEKQYRATAAKNKRMEALRTQLDDNMIREYLVENGGYALGNYILYKNWSKRIGSAFCTACGTNWEYNRIEQYPYGAEFYTHNSYSRCPKCGAYVTEICAGRRKHIAERQDIIFLQRIETGIAVRFTECWRELDWDKLMNRGHLRWLMADQKVFYLEEDKKDKRLSTFTVDKYSPIRHGKSGVVLYCENLKEATAGTIWEHIDISKFSNDIEQWNESLPYALNLMRYPAYETMWKCGYKKLIYASCWNTLQQIDGTAKRLHDALKISREQLRRFAGNDLTVNQLTVIQREPLFGRLNMNEVEQIANLTNSGLWEIMEYTRNYRRTLNYYNREKVPMHTWKDLLEMEEAAGCDMTDDINLYPRGCRERHQQYVEMKNKVKMEELDKLLTHIAEISDRVNELMGYENDRFMIRAPKTASEIQLEGQYQHHCVFANKYHERMAKEQTFILFMRRKSDPDTPYYTLEVSPDGRLLQYRAQYNRQPDIEIVRPFIEAYKKKISKMHWKKAKTAA